jgi:enamine deaminase RidA (YjgF/YER057c/UK114 family)
LAREFSGREKPAVSMVETSLSHGSVAMDAIGTADPKSGRLPVVRRRGEQLFTVNERLAHVAVLPAGPTVYISGQAEPGDLRQATRATLENLNKTLTYLGLDLEHVVALKAFVTPADQIAQAEDEVVRFFADQVVPPISWVEWQSSTPIEIELVAAALPRDGAPAIEYLTPPGMTASPVFSRVTRIFADRTVYVSSLYGEQGGDGAEQVRQIFTTLDRVIRACDSDLKHLAKATYYVADDDASSQLNKLRPEYYDPQRPPAASKALVRGVGRAGRTITLDMIAVPVGKDDE